MGRQVNFYMLPEDELIFLTFLFGNPNIVFINTTSSTYEPQFISNIEAFLDNNKTQTLIYNKQFEIGPNIIRAHRKTIYNSETGSYTETDQVFYKIDLINGPFIEYSRCKQKNNTLFSGRIWAEMYYLQQGKLIHKGDDFVNWYEQVARWLRKNLKKIREVDGYLGSETMKRYFKGELILKL